MWSVRCSASCVQKLAAMLDPDPGSSKTMDFDSFAEESGALLTEAIGVAGEHTLSHEAIVQKHVANILYFPESST